MANTMTSTELAHVATVMISLMHKCKLLNPDIDTEEKLLGAILLVLANYDEFEGSIKTTINERGKEAISNLEKMAEMVDVVKGEKGKL